MLDMAASHALVKSSLSFLGTACMIAPNFPVYVESWERRDGGVSVISPSSSSSTIISGTERKEGMICFFSITMLLLSVFWSRIVPTGNCGCYAMVKDDFLSKSCWSNLARFCGC